MIKMSHYIKNKLMVNEEYVFILLGITTVPAIRHFYIIELSTLVSRIIFIILDKI